MTKKLFYKIGEACKILEIQPYVLRYWETEFPFLSPNKSKSGQRVYSEHEIDVIRRIKELLYEEGYTIAGAKKKLESELTADASGGPATAASGTETAAAVEPRSSAASEDDAELDAAADEEMEKLRFGVKAALRQAREILEALQSG